MAKRSIQGYVELASGLGELTRNRAKEAAQEIVALSGVQGSRKKVSKQASKLADELLKAAETNRKQIVRLVRKEVDSAVNRIDLGRVVTDVQSLGATVATLATQVDDLARAAGGRATTAAASARGAAGTTTSAPARTTGSSNAAPTKAATTKTATKKAATKRTGSKKAATKKTATTKAATSRA
ncbi:MAG TPA: hypothetical protein VFU25_11875, partial [Ornithinibacter sp.]|nr:hypothetical protein [Ornithinibacter sp.]